MAADRKLLKFSTLGYILGKPQTLLCIVNANVFFLLGAGYENVELYSTDDREMNSVAML